MNFIEPEASARAFVDNLTIIRAIDPAGSRRRVA
jgi:hypothetical protein